MGVEVGSLTPLPTLTVTPTSTPTPNQAHNLRGALQRSYISEFLPLHDMHSIHAFAGKLVGFEVFSHSFWHMLRWGLAGDIRLLWTHVTGVTGLVSLLVTPLIVWPMLFPILRKKIPFEWRKAAHCN